MAFSRSLFSVLLLCVACKASNVPAFLWGDLAEPNLKSNPLMTTTSPAFSIILSKELVDTFTVVFVEKTLSIEDFSHRNDEGLTSFSYLHENYRKAVYLSSVENAVLALDLLEDSKQIKLTENGLSEKYLSTTGSTLIIYLEDAVEGESRYDMLRRHDSFMKETVSNLRKQHSKVVGVYTGLKGTANISHFRLRRQAANSNSSDYKLDGLRLYSKTITLTDGPKTVSLHGLSSSTSVINSTALTLSSTLNFPDNSIVLNFKGVGGYWFFDSVTLNPGGENAIDLFPNEEVFALIGFSYRCGQNVTFGDGNSTRHIFFEDLKVQPVFMNTNETNPVEFGDSFNCVGFFSAPIWSGLFVVFILLSITFYGIMMMMDIRTMDRFDDPKGKTITINAE